MISTLLFHKHNPRAWISSKYYPRCSFAIPSQSLYSFEVLLTLLFREPMTGAWIAPKSCLRCCCASSSPSLYSLELLTPLALEMRNVCKKIKKLLFCLQRDNPIAEPVWLQRTIHTATPHTQYQSLNTLEVLSRPPSTKPHLRA